MVEEGEARRRRNNWCFRSLFGRVGSWECRQWTQLDEIYLLARFRVDSSPPQCIFERVPPPDLPFFTNLSALFSMLVRSRTPFLVICPTSGGPLCGVPNFPGPREVRNRNYRDRATNLRHFPKNPATQFSRSQK